MKERPILFSGPMVRAILQGRKTMTRRVVMPQPEASKVAWGCTAGQGYGFRFGDENKRRNCPYGDPGDRLWVRETFCTCHAVGHELDARYQVGCYRVGWPRSGDSPCDDVKWRPSIHMPRCASRITLEIIAVRVERLQDISVKDAISEGIEQGAVYMSPDETAYRNYQDKDPITANYCLSPIASFQSLFNSINGKRPGCAWADNPWVWVVEFERVS